MLVDGRAADDSIAASPRNRGREQADVLESYTSVRMESVDGSEDAGTCTWLYSEPVWLLAGWL
jgi:hypothetical protein